jgi:hypothetical protein
MRFRRTLILLTVFALAVGGFTVSLATVSMASVMDASMAAQGATQADAGEHAMPDCPDCGHAAVRPYQARAQRYASSHRPISPPPLFC